MGWSNFIIIEDWKMIIETSREVYELDNYIKKSIDKIIGNDTDIDISTSDLKVGDITVKDLCAMAFVYENASSLTCMDADKLFLYWLESRDIDYDIKSEFNLDLEEYRKNGYNVIRWYSDDDNDDDHDGGHEDKCGKENNQDNKEE